ncbi:MAG: PAS domain S-box protein [Firmicutes bacterium]|nr:PAS domain S-box protein [Bacillota bacterium]
MEKNRSAEGLRRRAEKQLQKSKPKVAVPLTQEEMQRFIQELEVYQIELEMQNDELHQARLELERSLSRYTDLYDFAPVGYFTLNRNGVILNVNLTGARMLRLERSLILNQYLDQYIDAKYRNEFLSFVEKVFLDHNQETIEIALKKEGQPELYVHTEAMVSEDRQVCRLVLVDISAQKKAEVELQEREWQYRTLFETMSQGVVYLDLEGTIIMANPAAEKILGMPIEQMQGRRLQDLHWVTVDEKELDLPVELHPYMVALRTGETVNNVVVGLHSPQTGRYIWLNVTAVPQFLADGNRPNQVVITFDDITYQKRMVTYNKLTSREKEVFKLLVKGHSRQTIAEILKFSPKTADKHKENLMVKLKLFNKEDILEFATFIRLI